MMRDVADDDEGRVMTMRDQPVIRPAQSSFATAAAYAVYA
jgi:hypothetical protein